MRKWWMGFMMFLGLPRTWFSGERCHCWWICRQLRSLGMLIVKWFWWTTWLMLSSIGLRGRHVVWSMSVVFLNWGWFWVACFRSLRMLLLIEWVDRLLMLTGLQGGGLWGVVSCGIPWKPLFFPLAVLMLDFRVTEPYFLRYGFLQYELDDCFFAIFYSSSNCMWKTFNYLLWTYMAYVICSVWNVLLLKWISHMIWLHLLMHSKFSLY